MSDRLARFSVLLSFLLVSTVSSARVVCAQTAPASQTGSATISGHVTVAGKGQADVTIILISIPADRENAVLSMISGGMNRTQATTDLDGSYQFTGVAAGHYTVYAFTPTYVSKGGPGNATEITVNDGDAVDGIDFALERGGVITGKVTTSDGRPLIGAQVDASSENNSPGSGPYSMIYMDMARRFHTTDDRGVYRLYGLAPGKYTVHVTPPDSAQLFSLGRGTAVYYPGVTDAKAAGKVAVTAGAETTAIDIRVATHHESTYRASGRVVDDSGNPVAGVTVLYGTATPDGKSFRPTGTPVSTDSSGEFHIQGLSNGSYKASVYSGMGQQLQGYSDPVPFEVRDADAGGIEIRWRQGSTVSGTVTLEGADEEAAAKLSQQQVYGMSVSETVAGMGVSQSPIGPDGSFTLRGLPPGEVEISLDPALDLGSSNSLKVIRVEQDGAPTTGFIKLEEGQNLSGIRVVVAYGNCSISGSVTVQGGKLPPGTGIVVVAMPETGGLDSNVVIEAGTTIFSGSEGTAQVDSSGQFQITGLTPGAYTVMVRISGPNWSESRANPATPKTVTLTSGSDSRVDLTVDLSSNPPGRN